MRLNNDNLDLVLYFIVINKVISSYVVRKSVNIFLIPQFFAFVLGWAKSRLGMSGTT